MYSVAIMLYISVLDDVMESGCESLVVCRVVTHPRWVLASGLWVGNVVYRVIRRSCKDEVVNYILLH